MTSHLKSSSNYIWSTNAVLGKGATGSVYQGMNKATGELVAVKAFNQVSHLRPYDVQRREFEVLSKVNHENIVKLIAIEEESDHKVLIMELCTGGSLFNILDDPANSFGLEEADFLTVLKHLAAGMKHLHDMRIIHRDLKPGNIMKFHSEDGQSIYKLTDFGAARELEEDQQFVSLYGTEEYLHPDLYERAVLRKPAGKSFNAKVDLWSIGVTLFHIATGSLPFRPYGGRKNKEMMHRITTEKESGMISGIQHSENGEIEWSKNLPRTCRLSVAFQNKITPLLAGLLECNAKKMWTFEQFFSTVTNILSHRAIHVFYVNRVCDYTLYLQPSDEVSSLKQKLTSKDTAQVPMHNQLLISNKKDISNSSITIGQLAQTTPDNPIILLDLGSKSIEATHFNPSSQIKFPEILNSISCEQDAQLSKACGAIAYCTQRNIAKCLNYYNLINQVPQHVLTLIEANVNYLNEKRKSCHHVIDSMKDQIDYMNKTTKNLSRCINLTGGNNSPVVENDMAEIISSFEVLQKTIKKLEESGMIQMSNIVSRITNDWQSDVASYASRFSGSSAKSEHSCAKIKDSWLFLHKYKSTRSLTGNESELHHLEKLRIHNNCKKLKELLDNSHQSIIELSERLDNWYHDAQVALVKSKLFLQELAPFMDKRDMIHKSINSLMENQDRHWLLVIDQLSSLVVNSTMQHRNNSLLTNNLNIYNNSNNKTETKSSTHQLVSGLQAAINQDIIVATDNECSHNHENLGEELQALADAQRLLCASLSENQNLFSELVALTFSSRNQTDSGQF